MLSPRALAPTRPQPTPVFARKRPPLLTVNSGCSMPLFKLKRVTFLLVEAAGSWGGGRLGSLETPRLWPRTTPAALPAREHDPPPPRLRTGGAPASSPKLSALRGVLGS